MNRNIEEKSSPATGRRRRSILKTQQRLVAVLLVCVILLGVGLGVATYYVNRIIYTDLDGLKYYVKEKGGSYVLCDKEGYTLETTKDGYFSTTLGTLVEVNKETGACTTIAVVDTEDGEDIGTSRRILMFRHTQQSSIQSMQVHTSTSDYTFYRDSDDTFQIKGYEGTPYDKALLSQLAVSCGYPLTMEKVKDPIKDANGKYTEYGLDDQKRTDADGKEYDYSPSWYRLVDTSNNMHTVFVGDMIPSGAGYYVRYSGRDAVYIMNYSVDASLISVYGQSTLTENVDSVFELPIETFVTPSVCYPMTMNNYFNVKNFSIFNGHELANVKDPENSSVMPIISFSYWDLDSRTGTFYANTAYVMNYPDQYDIDADSAGAALQAFYSMSFLNVTKLGPNDDDMKELGLYDPEYVIYFEYTPTDSSGNAEEPIEHTILVSKMTDRGTYYMTSALYDMVVEVSRTQLLFLDYRLVDWVNSSYFSMNLAWATEIMLETPAGTYHFYLDNSESDSVTNPNPSTKAQKDGTITSDKMKIRAVAPDGTVMESISSITVTDAKGFTWTIDEKTVKAVDSEGNKASIRGGKYETNSRGEEVVVLVGSVTDAKTGNKVEVSANTITVTTPDGVGKTYLRCGMANFRKFFQSLLYASIAGDAHDGDSGLTDEQIASYTADPTKAQAKLTILTSFEKRPKFEYTFYAYTERRSLIQVGDSTEFYVTRSFVDKIIADAARVMTGEAITPTGKY